MAEMGFRAYLSFDHAMTADRSLFILPRPREGGVISSTCRWLALWAGMLLTSAAAAGAPIAAFALNDLNAGSSRTGQVLSPRDYGQWISAYYFGNEG